MTIRGIPHVGISVTSLEQSIAFYRDVLGMELVAEPEEFAGEQYAAIMNLENVSGRAALLRCSNVEIELFEFLSPSPGPATLDRRVSDQGLTHLCLEVDDIEGEYGRLRNARVRFHCPPIDFGTAKATYARDPDGNVFELLELT